MRPTRVMYVENDPALRGIMTKVLATRVELDVVLAVGSADEALSAPESKVADVALLDLGLGPLSMNGVELGLALQAMNSNLGIVLHSQHPLEYALDRVPPAQHFSWSTVPKSADMDIDDLVRILRNTASGKPSIAKVHGAMTPRDNPLDRLSEQQRLVMSLAANGYSASQIADQLTLSYGAVRQVMSRSYRILVPDDSSGTDLRTQAVLEYTRLMRDQQWEDQ